MGCEVVVAGALAAEARAVEEVFAERERTFSRFRDDSELNGVNAVAGSVAVSDVFAATMAVALDAAAVTGGLVDPTLGAAVIAAGYDRDFAELEESRTTPPRPGAPGCWGSVRLTGRLLTRPQGVSLRPERRRQGARGR